MEIIFNTQKLAKLCNNGKEASKQKIRVKK